MAKVAFSDINTKFTPKLWSTRLLAQAEKRTFWNRFEGPEGSGAAIIRMDDLTKSPGDTVHCPLVLELSGAGITSDATALQGNEEKMIFAQTDVTIGYLSHAVEWTERSADHVTWSMRTTALGQLSKWLAGKLDNDMWTELTGGGTTVPTKNEWVAGFGTVSGGASVNNITDAAGAGQLDLNTITDVKAYAEAELLLEPIQTVNGEGYYGLVIHNYAGLPLKKSTAYQTALREARERDPGNPLFTGALGMWDGVILYSANRVPTATNANATPTQYAKNVLFGAQMAARAFSKYPDWREEDTDYARNSGVATVLEYGQKLSVYDLSTAQDGSGDQAIGSVVLYSSAVASHS